MEKKEKKHYEAPELTVVSVRSERGYASSGDVPTLNLLNLWLGALGGDQMETYEVQNSWDEGSNTFWE